MENILKIKGNEVKIISKDIIEISEEIKTPQGLFLFLKKHKDEIEEVIATTKGFDKEMLVAVSICENFYYNDEKEKIWANRDNGSISLGYGDVCICTSNVETPCQSDGIREMFYTENTEEIAPLVNDNREKYKKIFQLYPLVKSENQIFELTFIPGEWIIIDKEVKNAPNLSMIIAKEFVASVVNGKAIDEITFYSETIDNWRNIHYSKNDDYLILKSEKTKIEFEEDIATCYCNDGNEYIFNENEMIDYDQRVPAEERHNDLKEIKKLLKLSLELINSKVIENIVKAVENSGELVEFEKRMKLLENF
jgi:hypothetical protein